MKQLPLTKYFVDLNFLFNRVTVVKMDMPHIRCLPFRKVVFSFLLIQGLLSPAWAQSSPDARLTGDWVKVGTGDQIRIKSNGELELFLSGQASVFNGNGAIEKCTEGGANLCFKAQRVNCAFRFSFLPTSLNLSFRTGGPDSACKALSGDFQKRQD